MTSAAINSNFPLTSMKIPRTTVVLYPAETHLPVLRTPKIWVCCYNFTIHNNTPILTIMTTDLYQTILSEESERVCFAFEPKYIPGEPGAYPITVANLFMRSYYKRDLDWDKDHLYTPADIDKPEEKYTTLYMFPEVDSRVKESAGRVRCINISISRSGL
jgi:hypothetical protein